MLLCLCDVFGALINSLVCWFCRSALGLVLLQTVHSNNQIQLLLLRLSSSSSSSFQDRPQTSSVVVLMTVVVCTRSSLALQWFSASVAPCGQCCVRSSLYWYWGKKCRTCPGACGPVSHMGSRLCVTDQRRYRWACSRVGSDQQIQQPPTNLSSKTLQLINHLTNQSIDRPTRPTAECISQRNQCERAVTFFSLFFF